ncbi:hypothetical protein PR202_ga04783 [Eleusine coracana subsp. coracana]|uniref:Uncharacterized protein n=1 Tax=Eleusine coracana subsp. coracana TaxID=191504 RepID=A0AAV5BTU3_ELECO|nr:hypothetical protein PR202_ga04783 [Eleusine coracana subsp. coracana]
MAIKWDKTAIIVCSVVGSLGVLSAIFGFSAEGTKLTLYTILVIYDACYYPENPAQGLAICAIVFLLVSQVTVAAVGGCCGCCRSRAVPSETNRIVGLVCGVVSWIAAAIAWWLLVEGAIMNANVVRYTAPVCYYFKDGGFAGAAVLSFVATALGLASFMLLRDGTTTKPRELEQANRSSGGDVTPVGPSPRAAEVTPISKPAVVPMVQPVFPQPQLGVPAMQPPQQPLPAAANAMGQQQPQVVYVMQTPTQPQYHVVPPPAVPVLAVPPPPAPLQEVAAGLPGENQQEGVTKDDMIKAGINLGAKVFMGAVNQSLAPENADPAAIAGDILLQMATGGNGASC